MRLLVSGLLVVVVVIGLVDAFVIPRKFKPFASESSSPSPNALVGKSLPLWSLYPSERDTVRMPNPFDTLDLHQVLAVVPLAELPDMRLPGSFAPARAKLAILYYPEQGIKEVTEGDDEVVAGNDDGKLGFLEPPLKERQLEHEKHFFNDANEDSDDEREQRPKIIPRWAHAYAQAYAQAFAQGVIRERDKHHIHEKVGDADCFCDRKLKRKFNTKVVHGDWKVRPGHQQQVNVITDSQGRKRVSIENKPPPKDSLNVTKKNKVPSSKRVKETRPAVEEDGPGFEEAGPGIEEAGPVVQDARPVVQDATSNVQGTRPGIDEARPIVQHARPNVEDAPPKIQKVVPDVQKAMSNVEEAPPNIQEVLPKIQRGSKVSKSPKFKSNKANGLAANEPFSKKDLRQPSSPLSSKKSGPPLEETQRKKFQKTHWKLSLDKNPV